MTQYKQTVCLKNTSNSDRYRPLEFPFHTHLQKRPLLFSVIVVNYAVALLLITALPSIATFDRDGSYQFLKSERTVQLVDQRKQVVF